VWIIRSNSRLPSNAVKHLPHIFYYPICQFDNRNVHNDTVILSHLKRSDFGHSICTSQLLQRRSLFNEATGSYWHDFGSSLTIPVINRISAADITKKRRQPREPWDRTGYDARSPAVLACLTAIDFGEFVIIKRQVNCYIPCLAYVRSITPARVKPAASEQYRKICNYRRSRLTVVSTGINHYGRNKAGHYIGLFPM